MMSAPAEARHSAIARPMPWLAPVTTASLPSRLSMLSAKAAGVVEFVMSVRLLVGRSCAGPVCLEPRVAERSCLGGWRGSGSVTEGGGDFVGGLDGQRRHGLDLLGGVLDEQGRDADAVFDGAGVVPDGCSDAAQPGYVLLTVEGVAESAHVRDLGAQPLERGDRMLGPGRQAGSRNEALQLVVGPAAQHDLPDPGAVHGA